MLKKIWKISPNFGNHKIGGKKEKTLGNNNTVTKREGIKVNAGRIQKHKSIQSWRVHSSLMNLSVLIFSATAPRPCTGQSTKITNTQNAQSLYKSYPTQDRAAKTKPSESACCPWALSCINQHMSTTVCSTIYILRVLQNPQKKILYQPSCASHLNSLKGLQAWNYQICATEKKDQTSASTALLPLSRDHYLLHSHYLSKNAHQKPKPMLRLNASMPESSPPSVSRILFSPTRPHQNFSFKLHCPLQNLSRPDHNSAIFIKSPSFGRSNCLNPSSKDQNQNQQPSDRNQVGVRLPHNRSQTYMLFHFGLLC